jgi:hypothetical protein
VLFLLRGLKRPDMYAFFPLLFCLPSKRAGENIKFQ